MERILIAEDDEKIAWLEKDYLESNGYEARIVANGDKVISEFMQDSYDLLLLDIMLPGMSGYDICRKIREEIDIPICAGMPGLPEREKKEMQTAQRGSRSRMLSSNPGPGRCGKRIRKSACPTGS